MSNRFTAINPGSDLTQVIAIMNKNFAELDAEANAKVYYGQNNQVALNAGLLPNGLGSGFLLRDTSGTPAIAMYVNSNGNPVLKVAKSGQDATLGTSDQLAFNSAQNTLKIVKTDIFTTTTGHTTSSPGVGNYAGGFFVIATIPHNLGYVPAVLGYYGLSGGYEAMPKTDYFQFGSSVTWSNYYMQVDTTNLYIYCQTLTTGSSAGVGAGQSFKYYLLQESAN